MIARVSRSVRAWLPVGALSRPAKLYLLAVIINGVIFSAWQLFFNFYILASGFDKDFLGLANSAPSMAALVLGIPLGVVSDRMGRKAAMLAGLGLYTLGAGTQLLTHSPALLLVVAFCSGIGNTLFIVSQAPFMMKAATPDQRALLFSLSFGVTTLAGTVGSLFAGQLPAVFGSWLSVAADSAVAYQAVLLASVIAGSLGLLPLALIREDRLGQEALKQQAGGISIWTVLKRWSTWKLVLPNGLIGIGASILIPYLNLFFAERYHLDAPSLGLLFSISALLTGIGSVIGPRLAANLNSKVRAVVVTQGASLFFLLAIGFSPWLWGSIAGFLVRGTLMNMAAPLYNAFVMEQVEEYEQGLVNSVLNFSWMIGWAVGPYISGLVQVHYGFSPLFVATAVMYGTAVLLTRVMFARSEGHQRSTEAANELAPAVQESAG